MNNYLIQYIFKFGIFGITGSTVGIGTAFWFYNNAANQNIQRDENLVNNDL